MEKTPQFTSLKSLQLSLPEILKQQDKRPELVVAALSNPILALEKLGYSFSPEFRKELETRIRFGKDNLDHVQKLETELHGYLGADVSLHSATAVEKSLRGVLQREKKELPSEFKLAPIQARPFGPPVKDPLAALASLHPAISRLVEYRSLQAAHPPLAQPATFEKVLSGHAVTQVTQARFRLSPNRKGSA
jgi:hypothetical protein